MSDLRVIVDTNILASSVAFQNSVPNQALRKALSDGVLIFSQETLDEFRQVILRPKFDRYLSVSLRRQFFFEIATSALIVDPRPCSVQCRDPRDQKFLELCREADILLSGDQDLLVLEKAEHCVILSSNQFLEMTSNL